MISTGNIEICAVGAYLPSTIVGTESIMVEAASERVGIDPKLLERDLGIKEVRRAAHSQQWSDLAALAAEDCLSRTNVSREKIGLIIYTGIDGDDKEPSVAHKVQEKLGIDGIPAYDISNACQGFVTGLMAANAHIGNGDVECVLVVTGEMGSRLVDLVVDELAGGAPNVELFKDKMGVFSVGDAGGAMLVRRASDSGHEFQLFNTSSRGKYANLCSYKIENGMVVGQMKMKEISAATYREHKKQYPVTMQNLMWEPSDINCLITHQVGSLGFKWLSKMSGVAQENMTKTYELLGNLTTATLAINLRKGIDEGQIKEGSKVLGLFSGSGITVAHFGLTII